MHLPHLSPDAWQFVLRPNLGEGRVLLIGRKPSGCAGFRYTVARTGAVPPGYLHEEAALADGLAWVAVAPEDAPHLAGTVVTLVREGLNRRLDWANPQEVSRCGCGLSVATGTPAAPASR